MDAGSWRWVLNEDQCLGCGVCVDLCEHGALEMGRDEALPRPLDGRCVGCGTCALECPTEAIDLELIRDLEE